MTTDAQRRPDSQSPRLQVTIRAAARQLSVDERTVRRPSRAVSYARSGAAGCAGSSMRVCSTTSTATGSAELPHARSRHDAQVAHTG